MVAQFQNRRFLFCFCSYCPLARLCEKILDFLKDIAQKIKEAFAGVKPQSELGRIGAEIAQKHNEVLDLFIEGIHNASENLAYTQGSSDTMNEVRESFYQEFDSWDGVDPNKTFIIGNTSSALQSVGVKNHNIVMRSGMIISKINKHGEMARDLFRKIPDLLESPIIVQFSDAVDPNTGKQKYDSRITVLGELYAQVNGKQAPVLVSLELLPTNQKKTTVLDFTIVTSAYAKNSLQKYINENSILYVDPNKKRTNDWLSLNGLQLPVGENQYGSIRRIAYADGKVKIQNPIHMTQMQEKLFAAGVIDEYGNIKKQSRDADYLSAVESGDMQTAQRMVDEAAKAAGYISSGYKGAHFAPYAQIKKEDFTNIDKLQELSDESADTNLFAIAQGITVAPKDYFSVNGARWYGYNDADGMESYRNIMRAINSIQSQIKRYGEVREMPKVKAYRAVPSFVKENYLQSSGQWVTLSKAYAIHHGKSYLDGKYRIIEEDVSAENLWWDANDIREWGYDDGNHYGYRNTKNNRKLLDPVTYDDSGNVIPLSERFNPEQKDIRYMARDTSYDFSLDKDLDTLDEKALKVYNKRGWAYSLFKNDDMALLHEKFDEYYKLNTRNKDNILPDGSMITDVNNKMLLIGGSRNSPVIHAVLYINADSEFHAINTKEAVYEDAKEIGINARQFANYLGYIQESENDGYIRAYRAEDYYHINGRTQERAVPPDGFDDFGYAKDYEIGRRLREEAQKSGTVKYDDTRNMDALGDDDLFGIEYDTDEIEDVLARHYLTHSEAIGEVLRNTADIEIAPNTFKNIVGRVLDADTAIPATVLPHFCHIFAFFGSTLVPFWFAFPLSNRRSQRDRKSRKNAQ